MFGVLGGSTMGWRGRRRRTSGPNSSKTPRDMEASGGDQPNEEPIRRRGRGPTKPPKLAVRQGRIVKKHVDFDEYLNPISQEKDRFISFIGFKARSEVGILWPSWKLVSQETKDMIWEDILETYDVPPTERMKKHLLGLVRGRWKDFKHILTKDYIRGEKQHKNPCQEYSISPEEWRSFVASRHDPNFLKLSEENKAKQSKNVYPHCMSRGGYRLVEENIMRQDLEALQEAAKSNPNIVVQVPPRPQRHRKWKEGRKKKGQYINPNIAEIARKIDELEEKSSQGSFTQNGRMDILATAIGKPDHPGRVRGESKTIGLTQYFGRTPHNPSENQLSEELAKIRGQVREELYSQIEARLCNPLRIEQLRQSIRTEIMAELRDEMRSMMMSNMRIGQGQGQTHQDSSGYHSAKDSYNPPSVPLNEPSSSTPEVGEPCYLYLEVPTKRIVAYALLYKKETTAHHMNIREDQVKVTIKAICEGEEDAYLPFPTNEVAQLGHSKGCFVLWPKRLVSHTMSSSVFDDVEFLALARLHTMSPTFTKIDIDMRQGIVGESNSYSFTIDAKDLREFLSMENLSISWLKLAIIYSYNWCIANEKSHMYGFLCPEATQQIYKDIGARMRYVGNTLGESEKPCYLSPIIEGCYWSLCVICPIENTIYWFDSLGRRPTNEMRSVFKTGLKLYHLTGGRRQSRNASPTWLYPRCPQQVGQHECGYFVIRFMYEIIHSGHTSNFKYIFDTEQPYNQKEVDDVRDCMAQLLLQEFFNQS